MFCLHYFLRLQRQPNEAEARRELAGRWMLDVNHDCEYGPIESDEIVLHEDGRMEQHLKLKDGRVFNSNNEHWSFLPKSNVGLESRWNFSPRTAGPVKESESLVVEFGKEPVIYQPRLKLLLSKAISFKYDPFGRRIHKSWSFETRGNLGTDRMTPIAVASGLTAVSVS